MEILKQPKSDLSNLLLDEIETLLAQTRLMELYLKQALATSTNETARIHEQYQGELAALRAELGDKAQILQQRQVEVESLDPRQGFEAELTALRTALGQSEQALQEREEAIRSIDSRLSAEIDRPRSQLTPQQAALDGGAAELQRGRESALTQREQELQAEVDRFRTEALEKSLLLQNRNEELVRVKSDLDSLQDGSTRLETSTIEAEATAAGEIEQMRTEFQAQLALLQAELSQKEWALEEQQATVGGLAQRYREQIDELQNRSGERPAMIKERDDEFVRGEPSVTDAQQERIDALKEKGEAVKSTTEPASPAFHKRRWRSGFGSKRRWKT